MPLSIFKLPVLRGKKLHGRVKKPNIPRWRSCFIPWDKALRLAPKKPKLGTIQAVHQSTGAWFFPRLWRSRWANIWHHMVPKHPSCPKWQGNPFSFQVASFQLCSKFRYEIYRRRAEKYSSAQPVWGDSRGWQATLLSSSSILCHMAFKYFSAVKFL